MHQDATGYVCLLIQPTKKEDAGWYTVSAKNEAGIISCTARLDIYGKKTPFTFLIFFYKLFSKGYLYYTIKGPDTISLTNLPA